MSEERWLNEPSIFDDIELLSKPIDELTEEDLQKMPHIAIEDAIPVSFLQNLQETAMNDEAREIINEIIARWERKRKD